MIMFIMTTNTNTEVRNDIEDHDDDDDDDDDVVDDDDDDDDDDARNDIDNHDDDGGGGGGGCGGGGGGGDDDDDDDNGGGGDDDEVGDGSNCSADGDDEDGDGSDYGVDGDDDDGDDNGDDNDDPAALECDDCQAYSPCVSPCPKKTCENRLTYNQQCRDVENTCFEGCDLQPCPPGQVYSSLQSPVTCIPETLCDTPSCSINGRTYREGERVYDSEVCNHDCEIWLVVACVRGVVQLGAACLRLSVFLSVLLSVCISVYPSVSLYFCLSLC